MGGNLAVDDAAVSGQTEIADRIDGSSHGTRWGFGERLQRTPLVFPAIVKGEHGRTW